MLPNQEGWDELVEAFERSRLLMSHVMKDDAWVEALSQLTFIEGSGPTRNVFKYYDQIEYLLKHPDIFDKFQQQSLSVKAHIVRGMEVFVLYHKPD